MYYLLKFIVLSAAIVLSACSGSNLPSIDDFSEGPKVSAVTKSQLLLESLPSGKNKVVLSVYNFEDKTGQHKPNDAYAEYSRAVTQGAAAILYKALLDAGNQGWFRVIEREGLENLLQERKIIRAMREQYQRSDGSALSKIRPMLYAGVLLEGGIVSYESNLLTGGLGARYLGIGGDTQYRQDIVTVYLRLVSVQSGEVLLSVNTSKTIYSALIRGSIFKFIGIDELLEIESGFTVNEPPQLAVRQAIEMSIYSLVMEGAGKELWSFEDPLAGELAVKDYKLRKQGIAVPLHNYNLLAKQIRQQKAMQQVQQQRRAIAYGNGGAMSAAPVVPVTSEGQSYQMSPQTPSPIAGGYIAPPPPVAGVGTPPVFYPAESNVQGYAQIPPDTRYVQSEDDSAPLESRPINREQVNGNGLYDYKVYCTKTGCRAVSPAP